MPKEMLNCKICQNEVPLDNYGRARQMHAECRRLDRSQRMMGNQIAKGHRKLTKYNNRFKLDDKKNAAYHSLDLECTRRTAIAYWGEPAELAYWIYDNANMQFFDGQIKQPLFQFCRVMPYGKCIGTAYTADVDRPVIDVFASLWSRQTEPYARIADVILHELLHFYVANVWREVREIWYRTSHNNEIWLGMVNKLQPHFGLPTENEPFEHFPQLYLTEKFKIFNAKLKVGEWPW